MARTKLKLLAVSKDITSAEQLEALGRRGKRRLWRALVFLVLGFALWIAWGMERGMSLIGEPPPQQVFGTFVAEECFREPLRLWLTWRCEGVGTVPGREPEYAETYNSAVLPDQIGQPVQLERIYVADSSGKDRVYWIEPDRGSLPQIGTWSLVVGFFAALCQLFGGAGDRGVYDNIRKKWAGEAAEDQRG